MADYHIMNFGCRAFKPGEKWMLDHRNESRLHYIVSGKGYYMLNGEKEFFKPGYIYIIPRDFEYVTGYDEAEGFKHMYFDFVSAKLFGFTEPMCINVKENESINSAINLLLSFFADCDKNIFDKDNKKYHITKVFAFLMELIDDCYNISYIADRRIEKILSFIHENYRKEITVTDMANHLYLNKSYFSKMFLEKVKMSPHEYLVSYRIAKGIALLKKGYRVSEVAEMVGYKNANSFSTAVKKYTGMPPKTNKKFS